MMSLFRTIFISLDVVVYGFVQAIFQVIIDLANIQLFNDTVIDTFANRIYIILGLVMLFKIMISFVQMLIDPDKMDDKEQGVGGLLKRVVISLALIVLVPSIFDLARQVQEEIIPVIPKVVLGVESDLTVEDSEAMDSVGRVMSFYTFLAFFNYDNPSCDDGSIIGTGSRLDTDHQFNEPPTIDTIGEAHQHLNEKSPCSTDSNGYKYKYSMLISTIVGVYLLWVLVTIAVEIAIRTLKLGICEFVAPIPIASYIDPKTSKQTFDAWVSTCWKTYVDLFIRLIIVYFMIFVFRTVLTNEFSSALYGKLGGSFVRGSLVTVFIITGVLTFAKEAPKFISEMLGLKDSGNLMGMFKGEGWRALGSSLGGTAGMLAAPISTSLSNFRYSKAMGESNLRAFGRGVGGLLSTSGRSLVANFNGKGWKGTYSDAKGSTISNSIRHVNTRKYKLEDMVRHADEVKKVVKPFDDQIELQQQAYERAQSIGDSTAMMTAREKIKEIKKQRAEAIKKANIIPNAGSFKSVSRDAWSEFSGLKLPTSKSYSEAGSLFINAKKSIFGEAKAKVEEKPDLVTNSFRLKDAQGNVYGTATYAQVKKDYMDLKNGKKDKVTYAGKDFDASTFETIYGNVWKDAASVYINKVVEGKEEAFDNKSMVQRIKQFDMDFEMLSIAPTELNDYRAQKEASYGDFFKKSEDYGETFNTKASTLAGIERAKEEKK